PFGNKLFTVPTHVPQPHLRADNPLTEAGIALGKKLFFEPALSVNSSQSCASCHRPEKAFSDTTRFSIGAEGKTGSRNAMTLMNLAWRPAFFWDGRARTLREQVMIPIENPDEMHETATNLPAKLLALTPEGEPYPALFNNAFGSPQIAP